MVNADLMRPRVIEDFRAGWVEYVATEMKSRGISNPARSSESSRLERNKTPTLSEIEEMVSLLSCSFQEQEQAGSASQRPASADTTPMTPP